MDINRISDALKIVEKFENDPVFEKDEEFLYTEALKYLFDKTGEGEYISRLAGFYYEQRRFELALQ